MKYRQKVERKFSFRFLSIGTPKLLLIIYIFTIFVKINYIGIEEYFTSLIPNL